MTGSLPLRQKVLLGLGYSATFFFLLSVFSYLTFPYGRLRDYLVTLVNSTQSGPGRLELRVGTLAPSPLFGATLSDIELRKFAKDPTAAPGLIKIQEAAVSVSPLAYLLGSESGDFSVSLGGGTVDGSFERSDKFTRFEAALDRVNLEAAGLGEYLGFPLGGIATGEIEIVLPDDIAKSNGEMALTIDSLSLGDGKSKLSVPGMRTGLTIEEVDAGKLSVLVELERGEAKIKKFNADGPDLQLDGGGNIKLASPLKRARLNVTIKVKFSDAYKERDAKTKALFELMGFRPELKRAMTPDGALRFELRGYLNKPRATPAGRSGSAKKR